MRRRYFAAVAASPLAESSPIFGPCQQRNRPDSPKRRRSPSKRGGAQTPRPGKKNLRTARGTSMGGLGTAKERAAAGLNPVPGIDMNLEDAEAFLAATRPKPAPAGAGGQARAGGRRGAGRRGGDRDGRGAVGLIESGRPEFLDKTWAPHRPPRPEKSEGGDSAPDRLGVRAEGRPAAGDRGTGRRGQRARARPGAARRHRLGQDLHHGQGHRGDAAAGADPGAEQDAGRPALWRVQVVLPGQRGRVFRLLLRLLPAGGLRPAHRHLYREGILDQRADRPHAPLGDALAARTRRRDHRRLGVLHLRHRLGRDLYGDDLRASRSASGSTSAS